MYQGMFGFLVVFNVTVNNISVLSWRSVLLVEETGGSGENHQGMEIWNDLSINKVIMADWISLRDDELSAHIFGPVYHHGNFN